MKKLRQMYRCMEEWMYGKSKDKAVSIPPYLNSSIPRRSGFTLVELVIVIAIVIILSVISVPIYRGYVDKSKMAEGYALVGTLLAAQKAYYSEHGNFIKDVGGGTERSIDEVLGVDARGNKYFTKFKFNYDKSDNTKHYIAVVVYKPKELADLNPRKSQLIYHYYLTKPGLWAEGDFY